MPEDSKEDLIVAKAINEAITGMNGLEKEIRAAVKMFEKGTFNEAKAKAITKKILAYMGKQTKVTKLQNAPIFGRLSAQSQSDVVWLDSVVNDLNNVLGGLADVLKLMKKKPEKKGDLTILVKETRRLEPRISQPPKGVGTLIKEVKKGIDGSHPQFPSISLLPMIILLWLVVDTIVRGIKARRPV